MLDDENTIEQLEPTQEDFEEQKLEGASSPDAAPAEDSKPLANPYEEIKKQEVESEAVVETAKPTTEIGKRESVKKAFKDLGTKIKTVGKKDQAAVDISEKTDEKIATLDEQEAEERKIVEETATETKAEAVPEDP